MTFTESDAQNDGLIKREVGKEMAKVAKTQNPQMFQYFENVCEEVGREPSEVFGEMAVRALNEEAYANQVLNSEVNMRQIKADQIRMEDVRYVKELSDELGLNQTEEQKDPIDRLINKRLESVTSSPLDNLRDSKQNPEGINGEVVEHMESLQNEISRLEKKIDGEDVSTDEEQQESQKGGKSLDDLFDGDNEEEEEQDTQEDETGDIVEMGDQGEPDETEEAEVEVEQEPTDEQVEEAFEGTDNSMDDLWGGSDEEEDLEVFDQVEIEENEVEIDEEESGDGDFVTSEDGEEE